MTVDNRDIETFCSRSVADVRRCVDLLVTGITRRLFRGSLSLRRRFSARRGYDVYLASHCVRRLTRPTVM